MDKKRDDDDKYRASFLILPPFLSFLAPIVGPLEIEETRYWFPGLVAETFLAFLFWCQATELIPSIWFGPMSVLKATDGGTEFFYAAAYAFPIFLLIPQVRDALKNEITWIYLATLIGIPSFSAGGYHVRSFMIMTGVGCGVVVHLGQVWLPKRRERVSIALMLGLFMLVSSRFMFSTLYVVWMSRTLNYSFFVLGIIAANVLGSDPELQWKEMTGDIEAPAPRLNADQTSLSAKYASWIGTVRMGVGFGFLQFLTQWLLSSHGVIPRWVDLHPFVYGIGIMLSMAIGIMICQCQSFVRSIGWWAIAIASGPAILVLSPKYAIIAGYIVTAYLASIWYVTLSDLSRFANAVPALLLSYVVYFFANLGVIWSIAWCFVPPGTGGPFMRQRVGQVFTFSLLFSSLSYFKTSSPHYKATKRGTNSNKLLSKQFLSVFLIVLVLVTLPAIAKRATNYGKVDANGVQKEYIRGMIWAIRFGYNNFGWVNFADVERKIKELGANTIGLVESDTMRPFNGNRDVVEYLEEKLHMYSDYGPSTMNDTWGCALFSVFPIVRSHRYNQPSPDGEVACLIDASLDVGNGQIVDVMVTHFGNTEHDRDRELQAKAIADIVERKKISGRDKVVWLGYLTNKPGGENYMRLVDSGLVDVSPEEQDRYIEYLFHMGMQVSNFQRVEMTEDISDTEIQIADFHWK